MDNRAVHPPRETRLPLPLPARLRRASRPLAAVALALLVTHGTASLAAGHAARRSFGEAARASLGAAATRVLEGAQEVAVYALSLVGVDYRYGGDTPDRGLDCSGLIRYVFQQTTGVTLPRTAHELARIGAKVPRSELVPGDLVFFNTRRSAYSHVGIYLGDGQFIHAPSKGGEVGVAQLSSSYWRKRYDGARRLVGVLPSLMPSIVSPAIAGTTGPDPASAAAADPPSNSASVARPDAGGAAFPSDILP
ncbi:MAG: C40 family peptidase [Candidatus Levyibacteriota bacterium]